jgi:hypothetical protein
MSSPMNGFNTITKRVAAVLVATVLAGSAFAQRSSIRWLEVPGQHITEADLVVSPNVRAVWVNGRPFGVHDLGYVRVPVRPGTNTATVTGRTVTLEVAEAPTDIRTAANQSQLNSAIQSMPNGGVIRLTGAGPYEFESWGDLGNGDNWIRIEGQGQTLTGPGDPGIRYQADNICFVNMHVQTNSLHYVHPDPGNSLAFIDCTFDGKIGDRWLRPANAAAEYQKFYFKRCEIVSATTHGFTDAVLVDRCIIDACDGDMFQTSFTVTRCLVRDVYETYVPGSNPHHKDNWQYFMDGENLIMSDVQIPTAVALQTFFWENDFLVNTGEPDWRTGQLRDHYAWSSVTLRRVNAPSNAISINPAAPWKTQTQFWGRWRDLWIEDVVLDQIVNFRGGNTYSNRFQISGVASIDGLICESVGFYESTGNSAAASEIPRSSTGDGSASRTPIRSGRGTTTSPNLRRTQTPRT